MTRVYYSDTYHDGLVYDSSEGGAPPSRDVQVIVQHHPDIGWHTQSKYDFYVWREEQGRWVGVDEAGLYDFLLDTGLVLFGRTLTQKEFNKVMARALEDLGEAKTGWLSGEDKPDG